MSLPPPVQATVPPRLLYVHDGNGHQRRALDATTERFVDDSRVGKTP